MNLPSPARQVSLAVRPDLSSRQTHSCARWVCDLNENQRRPDLRWSFCSLLAGSAGWRLVLLAFLLIVLSQVSTISLPWQSTVAEVSQPDDTDGSVACPATSVAPVAPQIIAERSLPSLYATTGKRVTQVTEETEGKERSGDPALIEAWPGQGNHLCHRCGKRRPFLPVPMTLLSMGCLLRN